jgi:DNA-binding transcriptional MerR regulator
VKALSGRKYTAKALAERFGCDVKTIHNHANALFGKAENGKRREFDEAQTTAVLERIKSVKSQNQTLKVDLQGTETALSLDLQIALAEREAKELAIKAKELWKRKALDQEARAAQAEYRLSVTRELLDKRETGLEAYQRIAESAGLVLSDRDDLYSAYRRGRSK